MADKRMFTKKITETDAFLDMPLSAQCLYFHLNMNGDDEGFVSSPKRVMRMIGAREDDYKVLLAKRYLLEFDSGVCVVKHWLIHNTIRKDRLKETVYLEEKAQIREKENGSYTENTIDNQLTTNCHPRLEEISIDKYSIEEYTSPDEQEEEPIIDSIEYTLFEYWNSLEIIKHREMNDKMFKAITKALKNYTPKVIAKAMKNYNTVIKDSSYDFSYKWKLVDFLKQGNALEDFVDGGSKIVNYLDWKSIPRQNKSSNNNKSINVLDIDY